MWIEIRYAIRSSSCPSVTPLAGVWIEMPVLVFTVPAYPVTPLAGVWIEIGTFPDVSRGFSVTPLAGVWIEIFSVLGNPHARPESLPLRECGLKYNSHTTVDAPQTSLPLRECGLKYPFKFTYYLVKGHSPCGSVD